MVLAIHRLMTSMSNFRLKTYEQFWRSHVQFMSYTSDAKLDA